MFARGWHHLIAFIIFGLTLREIALNGVVIFMIQLLYKSSLGVAFLICELKFEFYFCDTSLASAYIFSSFQLLHNYILIHFIFYCQALCSFFFPLQYLWLVVKLFNVNIRFRYVSQLDIKMWSRYLFTYLQKWKKSTIYFEMFTL